MILKCLALQALCFNRSAQTLAFIQRNSLQAELYEQFASNVHPTFPHIKPWFQWFQSPAKLQAWNLTCQSSTAIPVSRMWLEEISFFLRWALRKVPEHSDHPSEKLSPVTWGSESHRPLEVKSRKHGLLGAGTWPSMWVPGLVPSSVRQGWQSQIFQIFHTEVSGGRAIPTRWRVGVSRNNKY